MMTDKNLLVGHISLTKNIDFGANNFLFNEISSIVIFFSFYDRG
jgi:hypothetical protein